MKRVREIMSNRLSGALALSLLAHGLIVAALLITLPLPEPDAEPDDQVIEVTLVEPPEVPPEPPLERAEAPEPEVSEPDMPEPETPEPETPAPPAADAGEAADGVPIPVLRPVFRFGEQDSGPELALDGGAAEAPAAPGPDDATPEADTTESQQPEDPQDQPEPEPEADAAPTLALPLDITLPEADLDGAPDSLAEADTQTVLAPALIEAPAQSAAAAPSGTDAEAADPGAPLVLAEARQLFSTSISGNPVAMAAMGSLPRGLRASQLCTSELREQLRNAPERFGLELLPSYRLDTGNVLTETNAAFRADGAWYSLSFRCTVDDAALQVTGFAHKVGQKIPRSQWDSRGFPAF
ncbi:DUF930 domain-containing protein [Hoeflea sp. YIM 152468]|uniref:DUF930 domain-containing protein n=1 Tax=Hoeflea sp. YIM 152468 TaxID=3031759 RepID=UPI0023DAF9F5|nr:DUF930 domain-containing protein [Hoeflea sp. YIM 152468]MDF1609627.1 DUF930 domain-containing protein [Hoeflea sp. YIM 152468]